MSNAKDKIGNTKLDVSPTKRKSGVVIKNKTSDSVSKMQNTIAGKNKNNDISRMAVALKQVAGKIDTTQSGLFDHNVTIITGDVNISNDTLDCEFDIPFDDDTEANEAEIIIYNITSKTINAMKKGAKITVKAGYGKDTGVIFSGYISHKKTVWEDTDKITTINAIDSNDRKERDIKSKSYGKGTKASYILRKLVNDLGLPVAVFKIKRDHTYKEKVTVDGGLMDNIKKYAKICGVSAYICKSKVYVCPLNYKDNTTFNLSSDTGLLSIAEFEEEEQNEDYKDKTKGYEVKMLLQHQIQTGSIIKLDTKNVKGTYRVREGSHEYDGSNFTTTVKAVKV